MSGKVKIPSGGIVYSKVPRPMPKVPTGAISAIRGSEMRMRLNCGLGDIISVKAMLDPIKHKFKKIYISPNLDDIKIYREDRPDVRAFLLQMFRLLFSEPPYTVTEDQSYPQRYHITLCLYEKIQAAKPDKIVFSKLLCSPVMPIEIKNNFVVVTTKVRGFKQGLYEPQKTLFQDMLKRMSDKYDIVIMGEKIVEMNYEYQKMESEGKGIYSIYDDVIACVPKERIIDLTYDRLGIEPPNIDKLKGDCAIMNKAVRTIGFGLGGNFALAAAVATPLFMVDRWHKKDLYAIALYGHEDNFVMFDINRFFKIGYGLCEGKPNISDIQPVKPGTHPFRPRVEGRLNPGMGSILFCKAQLDSIKDYCGEIVLTPDLIWMWENRRGEYEPQKEFAFALMRHLFDTPPYKVVDDQKLPVKIALTFMTENGIKPAVPDLRSYLCHGKNPYRDMNYIVLTTRIRSADIYKIYVEQRKAFYKILRNLSSKYKIMIMGERKLWMGNVLGGKYHCIYEDIMERSGGMGFIDLSIEPDRIARPNLKSMMTDSTIMNGAKAVVTLGDGGNYALALSTSNIISFKNGGGLYSPLYDYLFGETYDKDGKFITTNLKHFFDKLSSL